VQKEVDSTFFSWSYSRGDGTLPTSCPQGFDAVLGVCTEVCPEGYTAATGGCWQNCPQGYTDMGVFCTDWRTWQSVGKEVFGQKITATGCADGLVDEAGLCYEPCDDGFTGVGPICFGDFNNSASFNALQTQVAAQHQAAIAKASTGGVVLPDGVAPELSATLMFAPVACKIDSITGSLGFIPDPVTLLNDIVNDAIQNSMGDWANSVTSTAWYVPSIGNTVLFDLSADAECDDNGQVAQAHLSIEPSITVQIQSRLFDTALHDLSGMDLGIMSVSVYELIPFRIYGTVGATMGVPTELTSVIDRSLPPLLINGQQYANKTALTVDPTLDLWLSSEAYLRVTSLLNFIPDLLQLGAEFKLDVLNVTMPYRKEEGLRTGATGYEIYREESLASDLSSGSGSFNAFLRILGIDTNAFGDAGNITWEGYQRHDELMGNEQSTAI